MRTVASLTVLALAVVLVSGCASSGSSSGADRGSRSSRSADMSGEMQGAINKLTKGMSQADVHAALGEPARTVQRETEAGPVDAWIYRWRYVAASQSVQTGTQSYSRENPITGQLETVNEPIMGVRQIYATDELTLVFSQGQLLEWAGTRSQSSQVN